MKILFITALGLIINLPAFSQAKTDKPPELPDSIHLEEITVSGSLPMNNRKILDFYNTNYFATVDNIISRLDGLELIRRGPYAMEPQVNGFSGGQLNLTIDGMKIFGACTDKMDPVTSYIEPNNLKSITVKQGTNSCLTGCNIGGSVDMELEGPEMDSNRPFYSNAGVGYESVSNGRNILFSTGYSKNKWNLGVNGVYRKNDDYTDGAGQVIPFSQFGKYNIHSALQFIPDSINRFKADVLYDLAQNVGYPALPMDVGRAEAILFALEYEHTNRIHTKLKLYVNTIHHVMDDSKRDSTFLLKNENTGNSDTVFMRMDMPGVSTTFGTYYQGEIPLKDNSRVSFRLDNYTNRSLAEMTMHMNSPVTGMDPPMYMQTWPEMVRNVTGLYIQNSRYFGNRFMLAIDGRIDYAIDMLQNNLAEQEFSVFNYHVEKNTARVTKSMNINVSAFPARHFSVNLTGGYGERLPTITERFGYYLYNAYDGYDYIGNPGINTEKSWFGKLEFKYTGQVLKINLSQSVNRLKDYIIGITDTTIPTMNFYANGTRIYRNIPGASVYNAGLQVFFTPVKKLSVFMVSKFTRGELSSHEPMPLIAPFHNVLSVRYGSDKISVQAENETALSQKRINVSYGEQVTPGYTLFNIKGNFGISLPGSRIDISAGISNLLNEKYSDHLDWGRILRPGRSLELFVKYTY